jgi:hypothetical protein
MIQEYNKREVIKSLYNLNKIWGVSITWKKFVSTSFNVETGKMLNDYNVKVIRAILLPAKVKRDALYKMDLVKIAGYLDRDRRLLIIKTGNLPQSWDMEGYLNDEVIANGFRYTPESIDDYGFKYGYIVRLVNIRGSELDNMIEKNVASNIGFRDESITA